MHVLIRSQAGMWQLLRSKCIWEKYLCIFTIASALSSLSYLAMLSTSMVLRGNLDLTELRSLGYVMIS